MFGSKNIHNFVNSLQ